MTGKARITVRPTGLLRRLMLAACPAAERRWVEAIFAEGENVDGGWQRLWWMVGAGRTVAAIVRLRSQALLSGVLRCVLGVSSLIAVTFAAAAFTGYEGLGLDDDAYLVLAGGAVALFLAVSGIALVRIFGHAGPLSGARF